MVLLLAGNLYSQNPQHHIEVPGLAPLSEGERFVIISARQEVIIRGRDHLNWCSFLLRRNPQAVDLCFSYLQHWDS